MKETPPPSTTRQYVQNFYVSLFPPKVRQVIDYTADYCMGKGVWTIATQVVQVALNQQQKDPSLSVRGALRKAAFEVGPFTGVVPGVGRELFKGLYKAPIMKEAQASTHRLMVTIFPEHMHNYRLLANCIAGVGAGLADATLSQFIERYKTFLTTSSKGGESFTSYIKNSENITVIWQKLTKGYGAYSLKQSLMMSSFFVFNDLGNDLADRVFNPEQNALHCAFAAIFTGLAVGVFGVPLDAVKTKLQMNGATSLSMREVVSHTMKTSGPRGLIAGFELKAFQIVSGYTFNALFINYTKESSQARE